MKASKAASNKDAVSDPNLSFPYLNVSILASIILPNAISLSGLFPYVGFMVMDLMHVSAEKTGYYAGYVDASCMAGRMVSSIWWGVLSDKIGRKPIVFIGLLSIMITSIGFGFSSNIWMAVGWRFLLGLFNPLSAISKTLVSEVCSKQHESTGMGVVTGIYGLGLVIGPAIGGMLSRPAESMPNTLGRVELFRSFPYLLPNIITTLIAFVSLIIVVLFFEETLPSRRTCDDGPCDDGEFSDGAKEASSVFSSLRRLKENCYMVLNICQQPGVPAVITAFGMTSLISIMFDTVFPLWAMSNASSGGFEYSSVQIGHVMSFTGIAMILYNFLLYPIQANAWGDRKSFKLGTAVSAPCFLLLSLISLLNGYSHMLIFCLVTGNVICVKLCCNLAFASSALLINRSVVQSHLATINGVAMTCSSIAKTIGPCISSVVFAWSATSQNVSTTSIIDFHLIFIFLAACALLSVICIKFNTKPLDPMYALGQCEDQQPVDDAITKLTGYTVLPIPPDVVVKCNYSDEVGNKL